MYKYNSVYRYIELSAFSYSLETTGDMYFNMFVLLTYSPF